MVYKKELTAYFIYLLGKQLQAHVVLLNDPMFKHVLGKQLVVDSRIVLGVVFSIKCVV
jgi:hypothetical protein